MRFTTTLRRFGNNTGIEVPPEVIEALGGGKRPAVSVRIGDFAFTSTVGVMQGLTLIPFSAERRAQSGLSGGEEITVDLELDSAPRTAVVPDDLRAALDSAGKTDAFARLSPSARRAHVTQVEGAKAAETRARRIAAIVDRL
ncbi:YdeI/OmpD-associated family protein [Microbacterium invictum]|uniref:YdeI/OmpD-associated family protein n=1 Tax=Microbacterium invictum TaxID=515415 RepID=A0ABZ0VAF3_9MICO|nr:YdeI/OmpD-associated family protein [Microbacterium invictum]WQB70598.1 YdeI/OmpD-associated family protein [Microbacterium invictum]